MVINYRDELWYEYELDKEQEKEFVVQELTKNQGFDKETAEKIYNNVIDNYELTEKFFEVCKEEVKEYFRELAEKEYREYVLG